MSERSHRALAPHPWQSYGPRAGDARCVVRSGRRVRRLTRSRFYVYDITEGPFPTSSYRSRIAVEGANGGSTVVWQTDFEPDDPASEQELIETFAGVYRAGLEAVRDRCQGAAHA